MVRGVVFADGTDRSDAINAAAQLYAVPARIIVAGAIAESRLGKYRERWGIWPDVSFGDWHQTVRYAPYGDQTNSPDNVELVRRKFLDDWDYSLEVATRQYATYWGRTADALETLSRYNRPTKAFADNKNAAAIRKAWDESAQYEESEMDGPVNQGDDLQYAIDLLNDARYIQRAKDSNFAWDEVGAAVDVLNNLHVALPAAPTQEEEAPVIEPDSQTDSPHATLRGFLAVHHWDGDIRAVDWYAGPYGTPISWPISGVVREFQTPGPAGTNLITAVLRAFDDRYHCFTHAEDVREGPCVAGVPFARIGVSGIESLPGDPAHIHYFCVLGSEANLQAAMQTGKGNYPAINALAELGFQFDVVDRIPGPVDYLMGRARAGRFI